MTQMRKPIIIYLLARSRIHERAVLLGLRAIILRVRTLEVSIYNVCITNQFQTTVALVVAVNSKEENSQDFCPNYFQEFGLKLRFFDALYRTIHFLSFYRGCILFWSSCRGLIVIRYMRQGPSPPLSYPLVFIYPWCVTYCCCWEGPPLPS